MGETAKADALRVVKPEGKPKGVFVGILVRKMLVRRILHGADRGGEGTLVARHVAVTVRTTAKSNAPNIALPEDVLPHVPRETAEEVFSIVNFTRLQESNGLGQRFMVRFREHAAMHASRAKR